jgi:hypothetical protein
MKSNTGTQRIRIDPGCAMGTMVSFATVAFIVANAKYYNIRKLAARNSGTETPFNPEALLQDATKPAAAISNSNNQPGNQANQMKVLTKPLPPEEDIGAEYTFTEMYKREFEKIDNPWDNWTPCDQQHVFQKKCRPQPATCKRQKETNNNHGIGNALITMYVPRSKEIYQEGCAPELRDKEMKGPTAYNFRLLDYVKIPDTVVSAMDQSCVTYSITQPKERVSTKVDSLLSQLQLKQSDKPPLVVMQLRSGWSDEKVRRNQAWNALGSCNEYRDKYYAQSQLAMTEVDLDGLVKDTAHVADKFFGPKKWRLFVASDAPAAKTYVRNKLESRTAGPVVSLEGTVGHNYGGIASGTKDENVEVAVNALAEVLIMSEADLLVSLSSKFPASANWRAMCPQRFVQVRGHPRHGLSDAGGYLLKALSSRNGQEPWHPQLADDDKKAFFERLPKGSENPCTQEADAVRACYCMLKLGHD